MKLRKKIAVLGTVATAVAIGGAAVALWSSSGSGSASAGSVAIQSSNIAAAAANGGDLYPGATKTITVTVDNPNPYPVELRRIPGASAVTQGDCTGSFVTVAELGDGTTAVPQAAGAGTIIPAKGETNGSGTYTMSVTMASGAPNACAGKTFTFNLSNASLMQAASS